MKINNRKINLIICHILLISLVVCQENIEEKLKKLESELEEKKIISPQNLNTFPLPNTYPAVKGIQNCNSPEECIQKGKLYYTNLKRNLQGRQGIIVKIFEFKIL